MYETIIEKERKKNGNIPEDKKEITIQILDQIKNFNENIESNKTKEDN